MRVRPVKLPTTGEQLDDWYAEHPWITVDNSCPEPLQQPCPAHKNPDDDDHNR